MQNLLVMKIFLPWLMIRFCIKNQALVVDTPLLMFACLGEFRVMYHRNERSCPKKGPNANPVFMAYCIASVDGSATLFVDEAKLPPAVQAHLAKARVTVRPYAAVESAPGQPPLPLPIDLLRRGCPRALVEDAGAVYTYDPAQCNMKLYQTLQSHKVRPTPHTCEDREGPALMTGLPAMSKGPSSRSSMPGGTLHPNDRSNRGAAGGRGQCSPQLSLVSVAKAVKNDVELEGMRRAHLPGPGP